MATLAKRYVCDKYDNCRYTDWDIWIRWVVLVVIIAIFLLAFFLCSCSNARRRRQQGLAPRYGTGWAARPMYHQGGQNYAPPPPVYSQNMPDGHQTFYGAGPGGPNGGIELQQPSPAYAAGGSSYMAPDVYAPPEGPPPVKGGMK